MDQQQNYSSALYYSDAPKIQCISSVSTSGCATVAKDCAVSKDEGGTGTVRGAIRLEQVAN